jgi:hypothetical protein
MAAVTARTMPSEAVLAELAGPLAGRTAHRELRLATLGRIVGQAWQRRANQRTMNRAISLVGPHRNGRHLDGFFRDHFGLGLDHERRIV